MRRWQVFMAFVSISLMLAPAADAAASLEDGPSEIVSGLLVDTAERPVAGGVELYAWPTGRPVRVGESPQLVPVGFVRTGDDGRFAVRSGVIRDVAELAELNGGYVNFELRAFAPGGVIQETYFSRYLDSARFAAQAADGRQVRRRPEWEAEPDQPAEPLRIALSAPSNGGSRPVNRISPMQGGCYGLKLLETQIAETVIGELRTPPDTKTASFRYGKQADSEISAAGKGAKGPWELSGSHHIGNAQGGAVTQKASGGQHLIVRSRFAYDRYEHFCPSGRREKIVPREWKGDVMSVPTPERGCKYASQDNLGKYGADTLFDRSKERAVTWSGAASIFGASISARSGYSQRVAANWEFGSQPLHLLCGDDGPPWASRHVFAGFSA
jgi:hypothetical protein